MPVPRKFKRVFVANRGEIAVRVIRECRRRGIEAILGVSEVDRGSLGAQLAHQTFCIGPAPAPQSYLRAELLVDAAMKTGCDAVHPGYGFLAEDAEFAQLCKSEGLTFIGPRPELLSLFGDKVAAREIATSAGIPVSKGSGALANLDEAATEAEKLGYPVVLKAVNGGGGKGMRVVRDEAGLRRDFDSAKAEALAAFGDPNVYFEQWVDRARHVEVQVAGDGRRRWIHFGDRDCSIQRRHQKLIEEAPAFGLTAELQEAIRLAAVALCQEVEYDSIGTVEFLVDVERQSFFFLEVNARLQVEHGVTELITGRDLVDCQMDLATGEDLAYVQAEVVFHGAAIEARINAEQPKLGFRPSPGRVSRLHLPAGPGVRVDSHCFQNYVVSPFYDSLVAKVMSFGPSRAWAVQRLIAALDELVMDGIETTRDLLSEVVSSPSFLAGEVWTQWLDQQVSSGSLRAAEVSPA